MNELNFQTWIQEEPRDQSQVSWEDCPTEPLRTHCALQQAAGFRASCVVPLPQLPISRLRRLDECLEQVAERLDPTVVLLIVTEQAHSP